MLQLHLARDKCWLVRRHPRGVDAKAGATQLVAMPLGRLHFAIAGNCPELGQVAEVAINGRGTGALALVDCVFAHVFRRPQLARRTTVELRAAAESNAPLRLRATFPAAAPRLLHHNPRRRDPQVYATVQDIDATGAMPETRSSAFEIVWE